jgi:hypothetical protein
VFVDIDHSDGTRRRVRLGERYRVRHTPTLRAELQHALTTPSAVPAVSLAG